MRLKQEHALAPLIHKSYSVKKPVIYSGSQTQKNLSHEIGES